MIQVESISKRFGSAPALRDVSFTVNAGEIIGLLGPNGAGKTTMMRILSCFMPPDGGRVRIDGLDAGKDSLAIRKRIGYFLENASIYPDMRVCNFLEFAAAIKSVPRWLRKKAVSNVVDLCGLGRVRRRIIANLSKGYRQRVGLAQALLNNPMILLLDEPASGLDPEQVAEVRRMVRGLAGERTVILSSHILSEVSRICNRVIIMDKGAVVASGTPEALGLQLQESNCLRVQIDPDGEAVAKKLAALPGVSRVDRGDQAGRNGAYYIIHAQNGVDAPRALCALAFENGWVLREISPVTLSLEDVFLKLTAGDGARA
jgi:ABC-2 type transport system ATP-binding protein